MDKKLAEAQMDMERLARIFGLPVRQLTEEDLATTAEEDDDARRMLPTPAEEDAIFSAMRAEKRRLKSVYWAQTAGYYWEVTKTNQPDVTACTFNGPPRMLGKPNPRPTSHRWWDHYDTPRRVPTAEEEAAEHQKILAYRRDRQRCKDLEPEAYRRETKLDETCTSEALWAQLAELGASTPSCVYVAEVYKEQAIAASKYGRFSMYANRRGRHVAEVFTDDEFDDLVIDGYEKRGRDLPVFDREGRRYGFEFTYSEEDGFYRLTGVGAENERFMADNNVVRDVVELGKRVTVQVFAFRSRKLLPEGKGFYDHPDGALGMIIIFSVSEDEDEYAYYIELDDDSMTVNEMVEHIHQNQKVMDD